jgi:hypothetical protein
VLPCILVRGRAGTSSCVGSGAGRAGEVVRLLLLRWRFAAGILLPRILVRDRARSRGCVTMRGLLLAQQIEGRMGLLCCMSRGCCSCAA